ncbi:MAG: hypothetical protein J5I93_26330 [Pirellulaceae bacterium]|nr:hypothetical protein [Pirellulaceae bacterium]
MAIKPAVQPVSQFGDMTCWAAAMEWWSQMTCRTPMSQDDLLLRYIRHFDDGLSETGLRRMMDDPIWKMTRQVTSTSKTSMATFAKALENGPIILGYYEKNVGGKHVISIYDHDPATSELYAMDPGAVSIQGGDAYLGKFVTKTLGHLKSKNGKFVIGKPVATSEWLDEYLK